MSFTPMGNMMFRQQDHHHEQIAQQAATKAGPSTTTKMLPVDFQPTPYTVLFGRGKKCTQACGNRRLRVTAMMFLDRYAKAETKDQKSEIVTEIQGTVQASCPGGRGAFVRENSEGHWIEVDSIMAREKISQVLRDLLHTKYRSSVKNKIAVRRKRRIQARSSITSMDTTMSSSEEFQESSTEFDSSSEFDPTVSRDMFE
eukprot:CAMPEP_0117020650 /NCGR_PEP_ID=MMETSP0472-20121206/15677_1 /TAXON_ID=693140 ORGANISM="Tiarina fusus, Strain LIS" /NCGR_SAMPLE_ID=MMETSP0472 /ASSEMBLY_ACC=CAM_ASM_000603 /LENGTH=199 /DNA_ID=CAMNT_0004725925 /DNA_START=94 /DNA_END=693 /DNA_ORIENTATION=+